MQKAFKKKTFKKCVEIGKKIIFFLEIGKTKSVLKLEKTKSN